MAAPVDRTPEDLKTRMKDSYDAIAGTYNTWTEQHTPIRLTYLEQLIQRLPSDAPVSILEVGCGAGVPVTEKLAALPHVHVTANDMSSTMIRLGKERLGEERITWVESDMMQLAFADGSLDAAIACYSMQHLPLPEQTAMLDRVVRWLKPGGFLMATFLETKSDGIVMDKWLHEKGWMYASSWGAEASLAKVQELGFKVLKTSMEDDSENARFLWVLAQKWAGRGGRVGVEAVLPWDKP